MTIICNWMVLASDCSIFHWLVASAVFKVWSSTADSKKIRTKQQWRLLLNNATKGETRRSQTAGWNA